MTTTVQKWGNSLGIRIPKEIAEAIGAQEGKEFRISTDNSRMIVELIQQNPVNVEKLIKKITPKNSIAEISWGASTGDEVW